MRLISTTMFNHDIEHVVKLLNLLARVAMPQEASAVSTKVYEFLDHALNLQETIQSRHAGRMW